MHESEDHPGQFETDVCAFVDPRCHENGVRFLCAEESFTPDIDVTTTNDNMSLYKLNRMILGLLESGSELGKQFPLNANMHHLNGVSFTKGCYIGQELTQRTFYTGVVRRVAMPFSVSDSVIDDIDPYKLVNHDFSGELTGQLILDVKGKKLGKVLASHYNMGVALVDLTKLDEKAQYTLDG